MVVDHGSEKQKRFIFNMNYKSSFLASLVIGASLAFATSSFAQNTGFTYQGNLAQGGTAVTGSYDIQFGLFTVASGSSASVSTTNLAVGVTNGLFTTALDFKNAFNGSRLWLDIAVRTAGSGGAFTELSPRQELTASPYALYAPSAGTVTGVISISNLPPSVVLTNSASLTNLSGAPTQTGYLFVYDLTSQSFPAANNYQPISFSVPGTTLNGWTLPQIGPAASTFTAQISGLYLIQYQAEISGANGSTANIKATLNNNIEIAGSQGAVTLAGTNGITVLSRSFITQVNSNDVLKLQFAAPSTGVSLVPNGTASTRPSVSLTAVKIK
jgi:hypothetical protein